MVIHVPSNEPVIFKRFLDAGLRSFMVPMVKMANDAQQAVFATRYFPEGIRGMAGNQRASGFGRNLAYRETYEQEQCLIAQIESPQAIEAIEDIGAVDGIDALFIGPNDLATNMGMSGKTADAGVMRAIASAIRLCLFAVRQCNRRRDFAPRSGRHRSQNRRSRGPGSTVQRRQAKWLGGAKAARG